METLGYLKNETKSCTKCDLHKSRTNLVFGCGDENAEILFIGEAPGFHEDKKGEPFVGAAGKLLDELLGSIGLARKDVYIANVLKCRPPNNRDPKPEEIDSCKNYLKQQIKIIKPRVVITLGNFAAKLLLKTESGISKMHGRPVAKKSFTVFPIYHPAAGLYTGQVKQTLFEDFIKLSEVLSLLKEEKINQMSLW